MAKLSITPQPDSGCTTSGNMIAVKQSVNGPQSSPKNILQNHPNNKPKSRPPSHGGGKPDQSPAQAGMDAAVIALDADYDALPATGTGQDNKAAWTALAAAWPAVGVCGCPGKTLTGKSLHRQVNFFRAMQGIAYDADAPAVPGTAPGPVTRLLYRANFGPPTDNVSVYNANTSGQYWLVMNNGKGLSNPVLQMLGLNDPEGVLNADPRFAVLSNYKAFQRVSMCCFNSAFMPGFPSTVSYERI